MITSKKELYYYIKADMMMNRGYFKKNLLTILKQLFFPDFVMRYLVALRKFEYYGNTPWGGYYYKARVRSLGFKLGFSIAPNVLGWGTVIPHYGTIVVGKGNEIGNYCVLQSCSCITEGKKKIGDALYVATGAKIINDVELGDNVTIGANAVLLKGDNESNCMFVGIPAKRVSDRKPWYGMGIYYVRYRECEKLREKLFGKN